MHDVPTLMALVGIAVCLQVAGGTCSVEVPVTGAVGHGMRTTVPYLSKPAWMVIA
jgi:hypothetical protein